MAEMAALFASVTATDVAAVDKKVAASANEKVDSAAVVAEVVVGK